MSFHSTQEIIDDLRAGRMVIIMDDEDRENEGDFLIAASHCTAEHVNFMARYGRGLICLTLTEARCRQLNLPLMVQETYYTHRTNFTMSIEAAEGVTTGISAADRARTIQVAVDPNAKPSDIVQPGHIFPLMAQPGGVLSRAGHTEAGCDLARLAGLEPAAVIVEILNDDGTMARGPDLEKIARQHNLKMGTIADLIRYRTQHERTAERVSEAIIPTEFGEFRLLAYRDGMRGNVHLAMVRGDISPERPTLVRVHIYNPIDDLTGNQLPAAGWPLRDALRRVAEANEGVVIILTDQVDNDELVRQLARYGSDPADTARQTPTRSISSDFRQIGLGAQILNDLGVRKMRVMSQRRRYHVLSGFGLEVVEYVN